MTVDAAGVFQSVSPSWTRILKHPIEAVVGRSFSDFIHPDDLEPAHQALRKAMSGSYLTGLENRFQTADGEVRHISWNTAMEDGLVYGYGVTSPRRRPRPPRSPMPRKRCAMRRRWRRWANSPAASRMISTIC